MVETHSRRLTENHQTTLAKVLEASAARNRLEETAAFRDVGGGLLVGVSPGIGLHRHCCGKRIGNATL